MRERSYIYPCKYIVPSQVLRLRSPGREHRAHNSHSNIIHYHIIQYDIMRYCILQHDMI